VKETFVKNDSPMNFDHFKKETMLSAEDICRAFYLKNRDTIKIKKEPVFIKNLELILNTTLRLSRISGFQGMSLRDLSRESGLSMGALYSYFSSKEDLLAIIHSYGMELVREILESHIREADSPVDKLRMAVRVHLYLSEMMPEWFYFFFMETKNLRPEDRKIPITSELMTEKIIMDILEAGAVIGRFRIDDPATTASMIKALLQDWYLKRWKYLKRKISVDQYALRVTALVEAYIIPGR
jgi:AcrR family transcriptional regulator